MFQSNSEGPLRLTSMSIASEAADVSRGKITMALLWIFLVAVLLTVGRLSAQLNTATLQGTTTDPTGSTIPDSEVNVLNSDTGAVRTTRTGSQGEYTFTSLQPGTYEVTVSHAGFQTTKQTNVILSVGQTALLNVSLSVGSVTETLEVHTTAGSIENTDTSLGTVIEQKRTVDLPLNGRQFTQLIQLQPGVVPVDNSQNSGKAANFGAGATSPGVDGQSNRSNLFFLDGLIDSNPFFGGFSFSPSVDNIEEFKAISHTDQAEFGQATGAIVSVVTRPGTNTIHGSVFEFNRNTIFNAQYKNLSSQPVAKLPYHLNQFGGSVGGPILKGKLFFFANYEGGRQANPSPAFYTVPTDAERSGDFSGVLPGNVTPTIYDPSTYNPTTKTESPFPGNKIPTSSINTGLQTYLTSIYPHANTPLAGGANNLLVTTGTRIVGDQGSVRIDYNLGSKDSLNGRYSQNATITDNPSNLANIFQTGFNGKNLGGTWIHTYTPTLVSSISVGYNTLNIPQQIILPVADQNALFVSAGFGAGFNERPGQTPFDLVPELNLNGGSYSNFWNGAGPIGPQAITQISGSVTKILGAHSVKAGGSFYRTALYTNFANNDVNFSNQGTWNPACQYGTAQTAACPTYNGTATDLGAGGDPFASLLLGLPIHAQRELGNTGVNLRQHEFSFFAQDTWQVTKKLTLNYGLRWDYGTPVTETNNRLAAYNTETKQYVVVQGDADLPSGALPANVVIGSSHAITQSRYTYFQPRIGIAYELTKQTTLRAGFGRSYDIWGLPLQVAQQNRGGWPSGVFQVSSTQNVNTSGPSLKPDGTPYTGQNPFFGNAVLPPTPFPLGGGNGFQDQNWQPASSTQYNIQVQQRLGRVGSLNLAYVGSETEHLTVNLPYNTAPPQSNSSAVKAFPDQIFGGVGATLRSFGTGTYYSFQAQLSRSFANGLVYNLSFTYSKNNALAICGTDFNVCVQNPNDTAADRGPTNLDIPLITSFNTAYSLPFGNGKAFLNQGAAGAIFGGFQINSIVTARSGIVINPADSVNSDRANAGGGNQRVNFVSDPNKGATHSAASYFNPAAFAEAPVGTYGTSGLNALRGPGFWDVDFSLFRDIPLRERAKIQLRVETFNLFNHPNLGNPTSSPVGGFDNTINSTASSYVPRVTQLAAKLIF
jgi:hypothetical protein